MIVFLGTVPKDEWMLIVQGTAYYNEIGINDSSSGLTNIGLLQYYYTPVIFFHPPFNLGGVKTPPPS